MGHHVDSGLVRLLSVKDVAPDPAKQLRFVVVDPPTDGPKPVGYRPLEAELHVPDALVPTSVRDQVLDGLHPLEVSTCDVPPVRGVGMLAFEGLSSDTNGGEIGPVVVLTKSVVHQIPPSAAFARSSADATILL